MLTLSEREKLMWILEQLKEEESSKQLDVSDRPRDEKGRFLPNQSELPAEEYRLRSIRLVKVKGSYGTYLVKDWDSMLRLIGAISVTVLVLLSALIL